MAYITYYPSKKYSSSFIKDYFLDSDISEYSDYSITKSNTDVLNIFKGKELIAKVSEHSIVMDKLLITKQQLGSFRWGWLIQKAGGNQLVTLDKNNNYVLGNRIVATFSGDYNKNLLLLIWSFIKGNKTSKNNLKLEFDETVIDPSFGFCLLFKTLCHRCNS